MTINLGDCSVTVCWKKASETTALEATRRAARQLQRLERLGQAA